MRRRPDWRTLALLFLPICVLPLRGQSAETQCSETQDLVISRDDWGVPHIEGKSDAAAFYGLGYVTARDRGFQMHYKLRIVQGRLAEIVGVKRHGRRRETTLDQDRKMRTFGFYQRAQALVPNLDAETRACLEAYAKGVNAYFAEHPSAGHPLFASAGLTPEPWTPADSIAIWWQIGQYFATDGTRDLLAWRNRKRGRFRGNSREIRRLREKAKTVQALPPDDEVAVVRNEDMPEEWLARLRAWLKEHGVDASPDKGDGDEAPKFSHAWVVGKGRSATGSTLLVSDPQTRVTQPSLFYEYHLRGKSFNARGIGVPGSPMLLIGFTEKVAWGITALGADQADLFRLVTDAAHPEQYRLDGNWVDFERRVERIRVRGAEDRKLVVRETVFGPEVGAFAFRRPGDPMVACKRIPLCEEDRETIQAMLPMYRAGTAREFLRAVRGWRFPSANLLFGDDQGRIAYTVLAAIPLRSPRTEGRGRLAMDGSRSEHDWVGFLPYEFLPQVLEPARGTLYSGNHRPVASGYPVTIGLSTGAMGHSIRSWRLSELLAGSKPMTREQVFGVHFDCVNPARRELVRLGLHATRKLKRGLSMEAELALVFLEDWYRKGASSDLRKEGAALATKIPMLFRMLQTELTLRYGGGLSGLSRWLRLAGARIDANEGAELSREELRYLDRVLSEAWLSAVDSFGEEPAEWKSRALKTLGKRALPYGVSLDGFPSLWPKKRLANPGLFCVDGSTIQSQASQSYTQMVDLSDVDRSLSVLPPGQSELGAGPFRTSTLGLWKEGRLHPAPLGREAVKQLTKVWKRLRYPR